MENEVDQLTKDIERFAQFVGNQEFTPPQLTGGEIDSLLAEINRKAEAYAMASRQPGRGISKPNINPLKPKKKMEQKEPTTAKGPLHEVCPEHKSLRDAMYKWCEEASEGENRGVIVIQVTEKGGELEASSHISGRGEHLVHATKACMSTMAPENHVGSILRIAAIRSLTEIGMIAPREEQPATEQPERPESTTPNNQDNE